MLNKARKGWGLENTYIPVVVTISSVVDLDPDPDPELVFLTRKSL